MAQSVDNKFALRFILIALAAVILVVLIMQYNKQKKLVDTPPTVQARERFEQPPPSKMPSVEQPLKAASPVPEKSEQQQEVVRPSEPLDNEDYKAIDFTTESKIPGECFPRDRLTAEDLLPKDAANTKWAQVNPAGQGDVKDINLLNAGFHIGVDTIGQSLRNANYQLRSEPPNPRQQVSPWMQSTIEYDSGRRAFELGEC
jgi:hypothetical protein